MEILFPTGYGQTELLKIRITGILPETVSLLNPRIDVLDFFFHSRSQSQLWI